MSSTETEVVFAGYGRKTLTVETSGDGISYLWIQVGNVRTLITLTSQEKANLAQSLFEPNTTTEITTY